MDLPEAKLYTISQAGKFLGISPKTLKRWEKSGKIKIPRTPTGNRFFTKESLEGLKNNLGISEASSQIKIVKPISLPPTFPKIAPQLTWRLSILLTILVVSIFANAFLFAKTDYLHPVREAVSNGTSQAVLGVESFIAPVAAEVSPILAPIGRLFSQVGSFFQTRASLFLIALLDNTPEGVVSLSSFTLSDLKVNNLSLGSTSGTTTINNNLNVVGDTTLGNLYVSGSLDVSYPTILTTLSVVNNATFASTLQVSGPVSFESTVNGNTFTNNSLVFSGVSPSISASTSNTSLSLNAGTTGAINIGNSSTGDIHLGGGSASSGCSVTNDNGSFNCSSNITSGGDLIANGGDILTNQTTFNLLTQTVTTLNIGSSSSTINLQGTASFTKAPTLAHTGTWAINSSTWNQSNATVYINPASATADSNLLGIAVNGGVKFAVDAEGDIYGNNLVVAGNTTTATTTVSGDLTVEGNTTLGDSTTDTFTINPATITLAGGNKTIDITGAATRTLTLLNSTTSQVADLDLSDGSLKLNGTTRITNTGSATLDNLTVNPTSSSQVAQVIKGATSQSVDLLQIKTSLDAVIAKVDQLGNITGRTLISTVSTGTAPLTVASTTMVTNLNANYLGGSAAADLGYSTNPNLILNSDFGRRNKWMTFMPEVFSDTSGWTLNEGSAIGSVSGNLLTAGNVAASTVWRIRAGLPTWRDGRFSAQFKIVDTTKNYYVFKSPDTGTLTDDVEATWQNGTFYLVKRVGGISTVLASVAQAGTINNYHWIELEAQGTTYIAKLYSGSSQPSAKSANTVLQTLTGTASDSAYASGYMIIGSTANSSVWGGLSTGDGGVYVEGWGPESWEPTFFNTKGGQAIGFDETADSGPLTKQWAFRYYIPATSRSFYIEQLSPDGSISSSTSYSHSLYWKTSGKTGGSSALITYISEEDNSAGTSQANNITNDASETSWTRVSSSFTTASGTRRMRNRIIGNNSGTATGTGYIMLPQLEQGSTVTPWRNAPADDGPIVWRTTTPNDDANRYNSSGAQAEIDSRDLASNVFLPWDANVRVSFQAAINSTVGGDYLSLFLRADGTNFRGANGSYGNLISQMDTTYKVVALTVSDSFSSGKRRIAIVWSRVVGTGTLGMRTLVPNDFTIVATRGKYDLAEEYSVSDQSIEAGDVVKLSGVGGTTVEKTIGGYSQDILGIISTDPGITLSSTVELNGYQEKPNLRPVALQGRVPVKVTNENGVIKRGDILTSSNTKPGYAMKATKAGRSIGIAMEDFQGEQGKILTFVNLSFYDPDVYLTDSGSFVINKVSQAPLATLIDNGTGTVQIVDKPTYQVQTTQTKEIIERTGGYNNLFVANLKVGSLDVSEINSELIKNLELRIKNLEIGTGSAVLSSSISGLLSEQTASSSGLLSSLTVSGRTILNDLGITGRITAGLLSIDGLEGSITSLTDIKLKTIGGVITIDKDGNLKAQSVETDNLKVGVNSSGTAILPANSLSIEVSSSIAMEDSKILITPRTLTDRTLTVTGIQNGKFKVEMKQSESQDIKFNWLVIN